MIVASPSFAPSQQSGTGSRSEKEEESEVSVLFIYLIVCKCLNICLCNQIYNRFCVFSSFFYGNGQNEEDDGGADEVESGEQEGSERDSGEDEDESGEEGKEGDKDAAAPQKPVQKTAEQKQKMVVQKSVQKKATQKPVVGKKRKPATNALLAGHLQGGNVDTEMKCFAVSEQEEEQELFGPLLKKFRNQLYAMSPHPTLGRFHKVFVLHYPKLSLFRQGYGNVRFLPSHDL